MSDVVPQVSAGVRFALLLVALEPSVARGRVESALALVGLRASAIGEAVDEGLLRVHGEQLDTVDPRLARRMVQQASDRERRTAHLALACARVRGATGQDRRAAFDALSAALDQPPADPSSPPAERLTAQERHVAELAATGAPTREIATAAFISVKTVEFHLTRVYRKLGVRSKAELASAFRSG